MKARTMLKAAGIGAAAAAGTAAAGYAALVVINRARYGHAEFRADDAKDSMLDRFIPNPEVSEHHEIKVNAPADVVMEAAKSQELLTSPVIRGIFRTRELVLGGEPDRRPLPSGLYDQMRAIGWAVLSERAGREVVMGAVTQPWVAAPTFRSVPPDEFLAFKEPGFVKIVWTLRVDPIDDETSLFHSETRVCTTDVDARKKFRDYWSFVAPGVQLIRMSMLRPLRRAAERAWKDSRGATLSRRHLQ
ncbi:MAG TPA: hypothetical protein VF491_10660 [Vicinamibacterales bacterium]|jgi:hypothetical protein